MHNDKLNAFGKLGRLITKRKWSVIAVWVLLLAIIIPVIATASGYTATTFNSSTETNTESRKASDLISKYFGSTVSNDSLILVISTDNASSIETQQFVEKLVNKIKSDSSITGIQNITSIYTILVPAINQTNHGVYEAYKGGNLSYTMLYSVPMIYSKVWETAYNTALKEQLVPGLSSTNQGVYMLITNANQTYNLLYSVPMIYSNVYANAYNQTRDTMLVSGLNQTNQGVYAAMVNANQTYNMLYSVPAIYLNVWNQTYYATSDIDAANFMANQTTAETLYAADPTAYTMYTSHVLEAFNSYWTTSLSDPGTASWTPLDRAEYASNQTNQLFINTFLAGNATEQAFATAVTSTFTLQDYLFNTQAQNNAKLTAFAINFVTTASMGQSTSEFVTATYNLGPNPSAVALTALAENIIQNPSTYSMPPFIPTFNEVAYNQTRDILQAQDPTSYAQYTGPLLSAFNTTWTLSFQNPALQTYSPFQRASVASNQTNQAYINTAFASNETAKAFATALTNAFTFENYLTNTQAQNNAQLISFSINYTAQQGNVSPVFVTAAYNLGASPSNSSLTNLGNQIIWYPSTYGVDTDFIGTFNEVSYNQTAKILKDADESAYNDYTSHLLNYFNNAWLENIPASPSSSTAWINTAASDAIDDAKTRFINDYITEGADFANLVANTFTLQDFINANTTKTNAQLYNLTINYVSNQSGFSKELITAIYNLGENASETAVRSLASDILWNKAAYNLSGAFSFAVESFISPTQDTTLISISFDHSSQANMLAVRAAVKEVLNENPTAVKSVNVTGSDAISYDFMQATNQDIDMILPITVTLLVLATGLFFRSIVTPIITLGTIGMGIGVSMIFPYIIGTYVNTIDYTGITVLLTVLIGVGTDYTIFVIARHREERINGLSVPDAIKQSVTWAGESIVTSGTTVIISFFALSTTTMVMLQTMGLIVGLGCVVTLIAALTVTPALTAILGDRIFWPNTGERFQRYVKTVKEKNHQKGGYFARSGRFSVKHGKAIILIAVLITVPAFYVYATTEQTYDIVGSASDSLESMGGLNTLTSSFGGGRMLPSYVVVTFSEPLVYNDGSFNIAEMNTLNSISTKIAGYDGIQKVSSATMPYSTLVDYKTITNASDTITYSGMLSTIGSDNKSALITVEFTAEPYSTEAMDVARDLRAELHSDFDGTTNLTGLYLGGATGGSLDSRVSFQNQFNTIVPMVALGVGVVLFFVLGSLILPAFAILSLLMSIVWTLAATIIVFQSAFSYGMLFMTPLILFVLLLGLGMDYNIFILTRIREEAAKGQSQDDAIVNGIQQTGGIITAAAIILAGSLGTLMISSNLMMREMGFAFAVSILIDALVVRTYIVPAVMSAFGKWNWYNPIKRLRRVKDEDFTNTTETKTD